MIQIWVRENNVLFKVSTKEKILPDHWDLEKQRAKRSCPRFRQINDVLNRAKVEVSKIWDEEKAKGQIEVNVIRNRVKALFTTPKTKGGLKLSEVDGAVEGKRFAEAFEEFHELKKRKDSKATFEKYQSLKKHLSGFEKKKGKEITFHEINYSFYEHFVDYLYYDLGHLNNTVGKYIRSLKSFLNWALRMEYTTNTVFQGFKPPSDEAEIFYLTHEEISILDEMDLTGVPHLAQARDFFCFGCFTGQRFSDIQKLKWGDLKEDYWVLRTIKTKDALMIPLSERAKKVLAREEKLDDKAYVFKAKVNQVMNRNLKEIGKMAGLDEPTVRVRYRGAKRVEERKPKYEFFSIHMARRTFVTLSLEMGMRPEVIMQITGHKDYATMKKYLKLTSNVVLEETLKAWNK